VIEVLQLGVSVYLSVCMFVCALPYLENYVQTSQNFLHMLTMALARSSSDDNAISTLCTSGFVDDVTFSHYMAWEGRNWSAEAPHLSALPPADWHPSAVSLSAHNEVWL